MSNADIIEEFLRAYETSFFGLKLDGKIYPAQIDRTRLMAKGYLGVSYQLNEAGDKKPHDVNWITEKDTKLVRGFPDLGNVKVQNTYAYVSVKPQRQFKKGYVPENAKIFIPNLKDIQAKVARFYIGANNKKLLWQLWNREFWHPTRAAQGLQAGEEVGYPLSRSFGLYINSDWEEPIISYKSKDVGMYKDGKFGLFKGFELYKEQFQRETGVAAICL